MSFPQPGMLGMMGALGAGGGLGAMLPPCAVCVALGYGIAAPKSETLVHGTLVCARHAGELLMTGGELMQSTGDKIADARAERARAALEGGDE